MAIYGMSSITGYSGKFRLSGLATGMDTDSLINEMMRAERIPLDRILQKRQIAEWKRDAYREMTTLLRSMKSDFLDILRPANNMLSANTYKKYTGTSTDSSIVTITGNSGSVAGSHSVSVYSLATADKAISSTGVSKKLEGIPVSDYTLAGKTIRVTLDGVTREITLDDYSYTPGTPASSDIVSKAGTGLQALLDKAFGAGKILAIYDGDTGKVSLESTGGAGKITVSSGTSGTGDGLAQLGFVIGQSNRINIRQSLDELSSKFANSLTFDANGKLKFTINSKPFEFDKSLSLESMMEAINNDPVANVRMSYDENSDKIIIVSKQTGDGDNIRIDISAQGGNFFGAGGASGIDVVDGSAVILDENQGRDAKAKIDGQIVVRSSNSFELNGVTYNLHKTHASPDTQSENVSLTLDVDGVFESIKAFVNKYNEIINKLNEKLSEKYDRNFLPLTDEQKEAMSEDDIKKWEEKAKTGLLKNDPLLQNIVYSMRRALTDSVAGVGLSLSEIGITTGSYSEKGKLHIDETKLKAAIRDNLDEVMNLFSKRSTTVPYNYDLNAQQKAVRMSEEGLACRISDILDENIRTVGGKGALLQKAGISGDATEYDNLLYDEIEDYNDKIAELQNKLIKKENDYYTKFTNLEKAIARMNEQSMWLASQFGQSG